MPLRWGAKTRTSEQTAVSTTALDSGRGSQPARAVPTRGTEGGPLALFPGEKATRVHVHQLHQTCVPHRNWGGRRHSGSQAEARTQGAAGCTGLRVPSQAKSFAIPKALPLPGTSCCWAAPEHALEIRNPLLLPAQAGSSFPGHCLRELLADRPWELAGQREGFSHGQVCPRQSPAPPQLGQVYSQHRLLSPCKMGFEDS